VVIEGDSPLRDADLRVFVAPPPAAGQALLVRERRDRAAQQRAQADAMERLLGEPDGRRGCWTSWWAVRWSRSRESSLSCWNRRG
jgi:hypothetical protein